MAQLDPFTPQEFAVTLVRGQSEVTVVATGELDLVSAGSLERDVRRLGEEFGAVVIDLRGVTFMDSTGLRALLNLRNEAARNGHDLSLVAGADGVQRVFEITGTYDRFDWRQA